MSAATDSADPGQGKRQVMQPDDRALADAVPGARLPGKVLQTPESALADTQALKVIADRHDRFQGLPAGSLGPGAARSAAIKDVAVLDGFYDRTLQGRAAAVMFETSTRQPTYKAALEAISPRFTQMVQQESADRQERAVQDTAPVGSSVKSDVYRATFEREAVGQSSHGAAPQPAARAPAVAPNPKKTTDLARSPLVGAQQAERAATPRNQIDPEVNSIRLEGSTAAKRRPIPPLEDRFNVRRSGLLEKAYYFRDQTGKVAFTDKFMNISTASESPAAIKAMVDRAAERGWKTVRFSGSPEFARLGWIAATAQGLNPVGHTPTLGDQETAVKERGRLQAAQEPGPAVVGSRSAEQTQSSLLAETSPAKARSAPVNPRQLAAAIEKALVDGGVAPELRGQVRDLLIDENLRRSARSQQLKVPIYDQQAPRTRAKPAREASQRTSDRERSR